MRWIYRNGRSIPLEPDELPISVGTVRAAPFVYVAAPYTDGDNFERVREALVVGDELRAIGCAPFIPHLYAFWNFVTPRPWASWIELDLLWLERCDAVLRLPGQSPGADIEVRRARELGLSVFTAVREVRDWMEVPAASTQSDQTNGSAQAILRRKSRAQDGETVE